MNLGNVELQRYIRELLEKDSFKTEDKIVINAFLNDGVESLTYESSFIIQQAVRPFIISECPICSTKKHHERKISLCDSCISLRS